VQTGSPPPAYRASLRAGRYRKWPICNRTKNAAAANCLSATRQVGNVRHPHPGSAPCSAGKMCPAPFENRFQQAHRDRNPRLATHGLVADTKEGFAWAHAA